MHVPLPDSLSTPAFRRRLLLVVVLSLVVSGVTLLVPRFAQPLWYHDFADQRCLFCLPHALNVLSNLPFVIVGVLGVLFVCSPQAKRAGGPFLHPAERWPWAVLFGAIALTGFGSAYYHADPNNARLLWDRLPLAVAFMALFSITIAERIHLKSGLVLLVPLALLGAGSVVYWHVTETHGAGDLRLYLFVQFFPLLAVPLMLLLFPARYTRTADLFAALVCYLVAKLMEALDAQVYSQGQIVSGHTIKHLIAGLCAAWLLYLVMRRRPVNPAGLVLPQSS